MVGSSSASAPLAFAAAADVSSAAARKVGLKCRPAASKPSTVAPSGPSAGWAMAGMQAIKPPASTKLTPDRIHWARTSLHQIGVDGSSDGLRFTLDLGRQMQRPGAGHAGGHLEAVDAVLCF